MMVPDSVIDLPHQRALLAIVNAALGNSEIIDELLDENNTPVYTSGTMDQVERLALVEGETTGRAPADLRPEVNRYSNGDYAEKNPTWHEEDAPWKARHIQAMIEKHELPRATICEVGCGTGEILLTLEKEFPTAALSGYEISPHAYDRAVQKETSNTKFYHGDFFSEHAPYSSEHAPYFDLALAIDVAEHVEDVYGFLGKLRDSATHKIIHFPLDLSVQSLIRSWPISKLREDVGHIHSFYKDSALKTLEHCGYEIVDHTYTASRLELPNQALTSRIMQLPRRVMFAINPDLAVRVLGGYSLLVLAK